jgi:hypothetical protein
VPGIGLAARSARLVFLVILKMWAAQELEPSGKAEEWHNRVSAV